MSYRWEITCDHLSRSFGEEEEAKGVEWPTCSDISNNKSSFKLYDDDKILYFQGFIYGDYMGFEPLDDFGVGYGCTLIKINGEWL